MQIRTNQDVIDLLQATRSLHFVCFNSYLDEDILVDIPIAIAYIDDEPDGWSACDSEGIMINKSSPNWPRIKRKCRTLFLLRVVIRIKSTCFLIGKNP